MTVSLDEHVARAIEGCTSHNLPKTTFANMASAAIAAVREWEGERRRDDVDTETAALLSLARSNIPTDIQELLLRGNPMRNVAPGALRNAQASIRESERAACEAIAREAAATAKERASLSRSIREREAWTEQKIASLNIAGLVAARKGKGEG